MHRETHRSQELRALLQWWMEKWCSESVNDEEGENLSTNSVSDMNDGNMIMDDFLILEEKLGFIKTVNYNLM